MRKVATALISTVLGLAALLSFKSHTGATGAISALTGANTTTATTGTGAPGNTPAPTAGQTQGSTGATAKTGTYTGAAADTNYGPVQVKITVSAGKLTDITVLQVPDRGGYEQQIVSDVLPMLKSQAISRQSANIDTVSGATYTSQGYAQSLQSALDQAGLK